MLYALRAALALGSEECGYAVHLEVEVAFAIGCSEEGFDTTILPYGIVILGVGGLHALATHEVAQEEVGFVRSHIERHDGAVGILAPIHNIYCLTLGSMLHGGINLVKRHLRKPLDAGHVNLFHTVLGCCYSAYHIIIYMDVNLYKVSKTLQNAMLFLAKKPEKLKKSSE